MNGLLPAVATAVFVWWFSTGLVLILVRLSRRAIRLSVTLATLVGVAALYGLSHTARQTGLAGAYCAFTCALLAWAWHELTFLTGWITGPRRTALPAGLSGWPRFVQSVRAILWHELGLLAMGAAVVAVTWDAANPVGAGTYAVLWAMRLSAKLNLYFGVRNFSEAFLPPHLKYLQSFFRRRRMNLFFPFAVGAATLVAVLLVQGALNPTLPDGLRTGQWLVATLLMLAIIEHWLLVLPLESTALWRWALARSDAAANKEALLHAR